MSVDIMQQFAPAEDEVRQYLQEIRRYPLLGPQEERELARRCSMGDEEAIRRMVSCNLRLVVSVAREYAGRGVSMMDLVQEGSIGLLAAAKKFDYTLDYRFSTYATKWIRQGISRCISNHGLIRVPVHTAEKMRKLLAIRQKLLQESGTEPSVEDIACQAHMSAEKAAQLLQLEPQICSLDAPAGEDDGTIGVLIENVLAQQPYELLVRDELTRIIGSLLDTLPQRQQLLLRLRYGLEDGKMYSLEQIGLVLGVSKERARQIEKQAMEKLKKRAEEMGLEDFLE